MQSFAAGHSRTGPFRYDADRHQELTLSTISAGSLCLEAMACRLSAGEAHDVIVRASCVSKADEEPTWSLLVADFHANWSSTDVRAAGEAGTCSWEPFSFWLQSQQCFAMEAQYWPVQGSRPCPGPTLRQACGVLQKQSVRYFADQLPSPAEPKRIPGACARELCCPGFTLSDHLDTRHSFG